MSQIPQVNKIDFAFHIICIAAVTFYAVENIVNFMKNDDLCEVSFKTYHNTNEDIYPSLTMCLTSPFEQERALQHSGTLNTSLYESYLAGGYSGNLDFVNVPYENVTFQQNDFLIGVNLWDKEFNSSNLGDKNIEVHSWGMGFPHNYVFKCFTFNIPYSKEKQLNQMKVEFRNLIYPNGGQRPTDGWTSGGMNLFFHSQKQFSRAWSTNKRYWPNKQYHTSSYRMRFYLKEMEVLRRRHKSHENCRDDDEMKYDDFAISHIVNVVQCIPPYWKDNTEIEFPICDKKEQLMKASSEIGKLLNGNTKINPPCTEITKINVEYEEPEAGTVPENTTQIDWIYRSNSYKEIRQMRAYTTNMLVGNVGGFFGLLLGYAFVQLPTLLHFIFDGLKSYFFKLNGNINQRNANVIKVYQNPA
jgi:hypothetical protein